jgi:glucokinase
MLLAGDIGGTSTRLAIFDVQAGRLVPVVEATLASRDFASLSEAARSFLSSHAARPTNACFGIAGPVRRGRVRTPNLPWVIDDAELASDLGFEVRLINDVEASGYGLESLEPGDFALLQAGERDATGNSAIIAAGTGLGEAGLYWDGRRHLPFACEGGHTDFAPRDERETGLLRHLKRQYERVSTERVLSGPGLQAIYGFLRESRGGDEPAWFADEVEEKGAPAAIAEAALKRRDAVCAEALDMFVSIYGAEAGNLALKLMATGGVYLGGGIAPRRASSATCGSSRSVGPHHSRRNQTSRSRSAWAPARSGAGGSRRRRSTREPKAAHLSRARPWIEARWRCRKRASLSPRSAVGLAIAVHHASGTPRRQASSCSMRTGVRLNVARAPSTSRRRKGISAYARAAWSRTQGRRTSPVRASW